MENIQFKIKKDNYCPNIYVKRGRKIAATIHPNDKDKSMYDVSVGDKFYRAYGTFNDTLEKVSEVLSEYLTMFGSDATIEFINQ